jgi:hypothetical protein
MRRTLASWDEYESDVKADTTRDAMLVNAEQGTGTARQRPSDTRRGSSRPTARAPSASSSSTKRAPQSCAGARFLICAIPNPFESGNLIAREANPALDIIARAHSDAEVEYLTELGASLIIMGEREIARGISEHIRERAGVVAEDESALLAGGTVEQPG